VYGDVQSNWSNQILVTTLEGAAPIVGDVNCDGEVTTIDITCLYNYLLNGDETYLATSDVNGDGEITTVDITVIYNILLGN
ncbi:MAG: dockerin type I repeat-containing protein, partial [Muribaculaceae bacterium]|nr:dockerin type I repeat-containing protein [Muribaculaceae bacterium]